MLCCSASLKGEALAKIYQERVEKLYQSEHHHWQNDLSSPAASFSNYLEHLTLDG
jgi:hypothetical protein